MIRTRITIVDETAKVRKRMRPASFRSVRQAAAYVWGQARRSITDGHSIRRDPATGEKTRVRNRSYSKLHVPSQPGKPPKSPTGRLKRAIAFDVDRAKTDALIGPTRSAVGLVGKTHEFSGLEPARKPRKRAFNFRLQVGGTGPVRATRFRVDGVARLLTPAQVRRAEQLVEGLDAPKYELLEPEKKPRNYPARPFMGPALQRSRSRIPQFWKNALNRS